VDLRLSSPTFGMWDGCLLTTEEHERVYVPVKQQFFCKRRIG